MKNINKIANEILKQAMPHLMLQDDEAVDLYFEHMLPSERQEVYRDLENGQDIELPNFGNVHGHEVRNTRKTFSDKDLKSIIDEKIVKRMLNQDAEDTFLEYNDIAHKYQLVPRY
jgi:nucleoid DNA-binding protein